MRKLLSLLTAVLLAGSMWGTITSPYTCTFTSGMTESDNTVTTGEVTWTLTRTVGAGSPTTTFGNQNGQSCIKFGSGKNNYYSTMKLTTSAFTSCSITSVVLYISSNNGGSKTITVKQGSTTIGSRSQSFSSATWVTNSTYNTTSGSGGDLEITISSDATATFVHSIKVTYTTSDPVIAASDINLGTVYIQPEATNFTHQYELTVTGSALSEAISYESSDDDKVAVSGTLTAAGGTLTVDVTAPYGSSLAETITLTSGTVSKVVNVTGAVQKKFNTPISVASALSAFSAGTLIANDSLKVRGLVKSFTSYYSTRATIVITDVDDNTKEFTLYGIYALNKANFASFDGGWAIDANGTKFAVGDTVAAYGAVGAYGEPAQPQISAGGYLIEVTRDKATIVPEVAATPKSISLATSEEATDQSIALAYENWENDVNSATAKLYSDEACTSEITSEPWVSNFDFEADFSGLTFDVAENEVTTARTAYIKISTSNASENAYVIVPITQAAAPTLDTYKPVALANIKSTDVVIVTMTTDGETPKTYALSSAVTDGRPAAVNITASIAEGNVSVYSNAEIFWNIVYDSENAGYVFYPNGETSRWLTGTSSSKDAKINTGAGKYWTVNMSYLYNTSAAKHLGVYNGTDWRCYGPENDAIHGNISGETLGFYVKDNGGTTALDNTEVEAKAVKTIVNGQLFIIRDGKTYTITGQVVK